MRSQRWVRWPLAGMTSNSADSGDKKSRPEASVPSAATSFGPDEFETVLLAGVGSTYSLGLAVEFLFRGGPSMTIRIRSSFASLFIMAGVVLSQTQTAPPSEVAGIPVNYDESRIGNYTLPDPLVLSNGERVRDSRTWVNKRRPEVLRLFEENQFGKSPGRPADLHFDVFDKGTPAFDGKAVRRQITVYFTHDNNGPRMDLLLYVPANTTKPVPVLLNISFTANSNSVDDPGIRPGEIWNREKKRVPVVRDARFGSLKIMPLLEQGIGVATVYYGDIDPDFIGGTPFGIRAVYMKPGQTNRAANEWGAIGAWGWGLSRALDYFETDKSVDAKRVAIIGVSRLGKTVLWAGANDPRFAMVIASCSGEGGASLSRRNYGETIKHLTEPTRYPYWFSPRYAEFGDRVNDFPVDSHMLLSLIAPRPVLLQTGDSDKWSDPKGEFLAAVAAEPVFKLLGKDGPGTNQMPAPEQPMLNTLGYFMHTGGHGTIPSDWDIFLRFMQKHLK
jgi:hypothetical protein